MLTRRRFFAAGARLALAPGVLGLAQAEPASAQPAAVLPAAVLPAEVRAALDRAQLPPDSLVAWVQKVGESTTRLAWRPDDPVNPASLMKLMTTYAALDMLGPAWAWRTPVWLQGRVARGILDGNLVIKGTGDPKLVPERVWLLLRRVRQLGVRRIRGDIVLDRSAFAVPDRDPAEFDGEPLRPYNVGPDALLLNYKAIGLTFTPDRANGVALVSVEPPLAGLRVDASVPLASGVAARTCSDWRAGLGARFDDPTQVRFAGSFSPACGEKSWSVAYVDPRSYNERMLLGMWLEMGGTLGGVVRDGPAPLDAAPSFVSTSPSLAEVVRDINKFSNNVMAQQLFLTLAAERRGVGTPDDARAVLRQWAAERLGVDLNGLVIDNGSGLSRDGRLSARQLARVLQSAWSSPVMPELLASLPVSGIDGTARRAQGVPGRAHLKTGSLRDVRGVAGYVLGASGNRYVVVAILNHANAGGIGAQAPLDALVEWTAADAPAPPSTGSASAPAAN